MRFLLILPILAHALMTAHLLFNGFGVWAFSPLLAVLLLFVRRPFTVWVQTTLLILWGVEWLRADYALVMRRIAWGEPWLAALCILGGAAVFSLTAALVFRVRTIRSIYIK